MENRIHSIDLFYEIVYRIIHSIQEHDLCSLGGSKGCEPLAASCMHAGASAPACIAHCTLADCLTRERPAAERSGSCRVRKHRCKQAGSRGASSRMQAGKAESAAGPDLILQAGA